MSSDDKSDWTDNVQEWDRPVSSLPVIPIIPDWYQKSGLTSCADSVCSTDLREEHKAVPNGRVTALCLLDIPSQPFSPTPSAELEPSLPLGKISLKLDDFYDKPAAVEIYSSPRFPPLPKNWASMNKQDKEAVLRKWSELELEPSENADWTPATSVDGSVHKIEVSTILRQKWNVLEEKNNMSPRRAYLPPGESLLLNSTEDDLPPVLDTFSRSALKLSLVHLPSTPPTRCSSPSIINHTSPQVSKKETKDIFDLETEALENNEVKQSWGYYADKESTRDPGRKWSKSFTAKSRSKRKKQKDFQFVRMEQMIAKHEGGIWTMKFNNDGRYLATGGQDAVLRVWTVVGCSPNKQKKYYKQHTFTDDDGKLPEEQKPPAGCIINPIPYREYIGHSQDVIDIDWSNGSDLILSASLDSTVMLWRVSRKKCISIFQHVDYVTSVRFHPVSSVYFVSASFDSRIRLWNIRDQRVVAWRQLETLVTAVAFSPDGKFIAAGLYNGQCVFFNLDMDTFQLKWWQNVECRSGRRSGKKITSIQYYKMQKNVNGTPSKEGAQCLVSSNDSRIRLFTIQNYKINLTAKYKGFKNSELQIAATFSHDGKFVIAGSEDGAIYIWNKEISKNSRFSLKKTDHCKTKSYELIRAPSSKKVKTTVAIFAPPRTINYIVRERDNELHNFLDTPKIKHVVLSADQEGKIKVFVNYESDPS